MMLSERFQRATSYRGEFGASMVGYGSVVPPYGLHR